MNIRTFTSQKIEKLTNEQESITQHISSLEGQTPKSLWANDLDNFSTEYSKWEKTVNKK